MANTVLRFEKIKSFEALNLSNAHINRFMPTPNANLNIKNKRVFGSNNLVKDVKNIIDKKGLKPRKNAVLAMEGILSLSPEFFNSTDRIKQFVEFGSKWIANEFGENVLNITAHFDEQTPHLHFHIIPINEKGRLSAFDLFNKNTLKEFQKSYCDFMNKNIPDESFTYKAGSKAEHTDIKEYYAMVNEKTSELKNENSDLKNKVNQYEKNKEALENKLDIFEKDIEKTNKENTKLKKDIQKLEDLTEKQFTEISNLKNIVKNINDKYNKLVAFFNKLPDYIKKQFNNPFSKAEPEKLTPISFPDSPKKQLKNVKKPRF
ncbi:plasmid recombination protein [Vibrio parahaemolyticus]|nr:plasmid recombination protein [Vibrio parahaemolyticus]